MTALGGAGRIRAVPADLGTDQGIREFATEVATMTDSVDVLVNNAGTTYREGIDSYSSSGWNEVIALNVKAVFMLTQQLLPLLESAATVDDAARVISRESAGHVTLLRQWSTWPAVPAAMSLVPCSRSTAASRPPPGRVSVSSNSETPR